MTDFDATTDRALLRETLTDEEWARVKAAEPGGGAGNFRAAIVGTRGSE